jgi:DNA ligase-1
MKRHADHYICTCIGYRNRAHEPVNARTCKHLRTLLGDAYEDARIAKAHQTSSDSSAPAISSEQGPEKPKRNDNSENGDDDGHPPSYRATPTASAERSSGMPNGTYKSETDYRDKASEDDYRPRSNRVAPAASTKEEGTPSKITSPRTDSRDKVEDVNKPVSTANESFEDPLREIKGIRPQVWLNSGEERKVQSESYGIIV